jgi:hypothetical protein
MPDEITELFIAVGRIEEGMRYTRESQERMEKKIDAQDQRISQVELDVKELKTVKENRNNKVAVAIAIGAVLIAALDLLLP